MKKTKKITLLLTELDGNAWSLMGAFKKQAKREGWTEEEIQAVLEESRGGDYQHLLNTLASHCKGNGGI